jgi:hypothetical protein
MRGNRKKGFNTNDTNINIETLIRERSSIHNASSAADDLFDNARATKERLEEQQRQLLGTGSKIRGAACTLLY